MVQDGVLAEPAKPPTPCSVIIFTEDVEADPVKLTVIAAAVALT